jgi:hypothetical protein
MHNKRNAFIKVKLTSNFFNYNHKGRASPPELIKGEKPKKPYNERHVTYIG